MKSALIYSAVVATILSWFSADAAPFTPVVEPRAVKRYTSPYASLLQKWISTANVTQASKDYAKTLLDLDAQIETFYKGDGAVEPTAPYDPNVDDTKVTAAMILGASGSAAASSADVALMRSWAQIQTATSCDASAITSWTCATCRTNTFGKPASIVIVDQNDSRFYAGYIASQNTIFVSFRGTSGFANWLTNLDFILSPYWISGATPSGARFHSGFQDLYSQLSGSVRSVVTNLAATYPTATVAFVGHSLGASLAVHAALDLSVTKYVSRLTSDKIRIFASGEPRIGNNAAGVWVTGRGWAGSYRAVNYDDIVPHLPYQWMGYRHHRREWWILSDGTSVVTCNDVNAADNEDTNCLNSIWFASVASHGIYFGVPMGSGC